MVFDIFIMDFDLSLPVRDKFSVLWSVNTGGTNWLFRAWIKSSSDHFPILTCVELEFGNS